MAATTAYPTSNSPFHPRSFTPPRTQFSPVSRRASPSPSSSSSISHISQLSITRTMKNDENNNEQTTEDRAMTPTDNDVLYIATDNETDDSEEDDPIIINKNNNNIDEEQFLSFVGLRRKTKKSVVTRMNLVPLTKRLACPVCLLPLPKYIERVRQALNIRLPFLKYLRFIIDIERFCSTDVNARAQSLLPRSAQTRSLSAKIRSPRKEKLLKTEFVSMAASACRPSTSKIVINKCVQSALQCNVVLDRLEQSSIDEIMRNSTANDDDNNECTSRSSTSQTTLRKTSPNSRRSLNISQTPASKTTVTTTTTVEKTVVKRKSTTTTTTTTDMNKPKRFKSVKDDLSATIDDDSSNDDSSSSAYKRIYLKCFVCSKRQHVDATATESDALHSHWLEHDGDLSLNIYDSEIGSILTRVVEFFNLPRQHLLEGKIKTVFIYNSKEIRSTSTTTLSSNDSYIVID